MQIFENKKVAFGSRDYQENVRRSKLCWVDKFPTKMDGYGPLLGQKYINPSQTQSPKPKKEEKSKIKIFENFRFWLFFDDFKPRDYQNRVWEVK